MRFHSTIATAATLASIAGVDALNLVKREDGLGPRVVQMDIERKAVSHPVKRDRLRRIPNLRRRDPGIVSVELTNEQTLYFAKATAGTPPQELLLHIDTGSSDMWFNTPSSRLCSGRRQICGYAGAYDANSSSTYTYLNSFFNISYVDGSASVGDYATDTFTIGDTTLPKQQFGIGYSSTSAQGLLGIGYAINEAALAYYENALYPNVPLNMMQSGKINSNAYSLWLNDLDASTGSILFGGVNTGKYVGELSTLPIVKEQGYYAEFIIALTGVGFNGNTGSLSSDLRVPILLDSGSSLVYLPNDITQQIYKQFNADYREDEGVAIVDCDLATSHHTIDFTFSSPTIRVDMSELVIQASTGGGDPVCIFGIAPAGGTTPVLGDTFLRSAYVVYDLEGNTISLAQTNFNSTESNVMEITNSTSTSSGVPNAVAVPNAVSSLAVTTGDPRLGDAGIGSITLGGAAGVSPSIHTALFALGVVALLQFCL